MTNPYEILGVSSNAGKPEIDAAYNRLIEEYKNSGKNDSISEEIYEYKIQELRTAYSQICSQINSNTLGDTSSETINPYYAPSDNILKQTHNNINTVPMPIENSKQDTFNPKPQETDDNYTQNNTNNTQSSYTGDPNDTFGSVRQFIELGRYAEAENFLNSIHYKDTATWHFLYGKMCMGRGWLNQASTHFQRAVLLDPSNEEYKQEHIKINQMKLNNPTKVPVGVFIAGGACISLRVCGYIAPAFDMC